MSHLPMVSRYEIMVTISSLLWNHAPSYSSVELLPTNLNLRHLFLPSLSMCFSCLSSRGVSTSHSMSWSWVARSLRRSIPVEFPSVIIMLDENLNSKDVKINWSNESTSSRRAIGSWRSCRLCVPSVFLPHVLNLGTRFLLVGVSCHSPSFGLCLSLHMHPCIILNSRKLN